MLRALIATFGGLLFLSASSVFADQTKSCNDQQKTNCGRFCMSHGGVQSCVIDISQRDGTCTCTDGTSHTKSK